MTVWPEMLSDRLPGDAAIAARTAYGIAPGPAGYTLADLACAPGPGRPSAEGVYSETAIAVVLSGAFEYVSEGGADIAVPGALLFGNRHEGFICRHLEAAGNRRIVLFVSDAMMQSVAEDLALDAPRFGAASAPPSRLTPSVCGALIRIAQRAADSEEAAIEVAATALQHVTGRRGRQGKERVPAADIRRILDAARYVNAHFTEPCSLDSLAAIAGMSRFRFARRFRAVTGETAAQYVVNRRLSAAAASLAASARPVSQIAYEAGFNDLSYFNARFKAAFGCAPSVWRRQ